MNVFYLKMPIDITLGEAIKLLRERWNCVYIYGGLVAINYYSDKEVKTICKVLDDNGYPYKYWDIHIEGWEVDKDGRGIEVC